MHKLNRIFLLLFSGIYAVSSMAAKSPIVESEDGLVADWGQLSLRDFGGATSSGGTVNLSDVDLDLNRAWDVGDSS